MLTINPNDYYYELEHFAKIPKLELLCSFLDEKPAKFIYAAYKEALRTYEEDLPKMNEFKNEHFYSGYFCCDRELLNEEDIFFDYEYTTDPFAIKLTISNDHDNELDFINHNSTQVPLSINPETGKLSNIHYNTEVIANHETWKLKYLIVLTEIVSDAWKRYNKMLETGLDEFGYVVDKDLARNLIHQIIYRLYPISAWKAQDVLKDGEVYFNDCNGGWCVRNKDGEEESFGYNGMIFCTLKAWLKDMDGDDNLDKNSADQINDDGIVIWPWNNENGYEIFVLHEGD